MKKRRCLTGIDMAIASLVVMLNQQFRLLTNIEGEYIWRQIQAFDYVLEQGVLNKDLDRRYAYIQPQGWDKNCWVKIRLNYDFCKFGTPRGWIVDEFELQDGNTSSILSLRLFDHANQWSCLLGLKVIVPRDDEKSEPTSEWLKEIHGALHRSKFFELK